jgi:predicted lipoprotein with Yx(FWY)xxD motif
MNRNRHSAFGLIAPIAVTALLIAGCGSSSSSSSTPGTTSAPASATTEATGSTSTASTPTTTSAGSGSAAVIGTKKAKLGTILYAGSKQLTVYVWDGDKSSKSACSGACAAIWPPVTTTGQPTVATGAQSSLLGTTKRSDGSTQVTYNGHPLYYFSKDGDSGDAYGEGSKSFGAGWYVMRPNGHDIDLS